MIKSILNQITNMKIINKITLKLDKNNENNCSQLFVLDNDIIY